MSHFPDGKISITRKRGRCHFYLRKCSKERSGTYLRKDQEDKIRIYLQKKYDESVLKILSEEIHNLETFLNNSNEYVARIQEQYSNYPEEIKEKIRPIDMSDDDFAKEWLNVPFTGKEINHDLPVFQTDKGEYVRSKSELNIANALYRAGIPYKYECPLVLKNGRTIYPDFTTLNVRERKVKYWEHRGMMDDRDYSRQAVTRIKDLRRSGIILGDNLIITEETSSSPLGTDEIEATIIHYLN